MGEFSKRWVQGSNEEVLYVTRSSIHDQVIKRPMDSVEGDLSRETHSYRQVK